MPAIYPSYRVEVPSSLSILLHQLYEFVICSPVSSIPLHFPCPPPHPQSPPNPQTQSPPPSKNAKEKKKRLTINTPIPILIRLANHLLNLLVRQILPDTLHQLAQLGGVDGAVVVFVEDAEGGAEFGVRVGLGDFVGHYCGEFWRMSYSGKKGKGGAFGG